MNIILGNPGSGKTKHILKLSAENNIPVLCESQARLERLLVKAQNYGYYIPRPIVYTEVNAETGPVYIDDIERLLETMFRCEVKGVTLNVVKPSDITNLDK